MSDVPEIFADLLEVQCNVPHIATLTIGEGKTVPSDRNPQEVTRRREVKVVLKVPPVSLKMWAAAIWVTLRKAEQAMGQPFPISTEWLTSVGIPPEDQSIWI